MTSRREKRWTGGENRSVGQLDRLRQKRDVSNANQSHLARVSENDRFGPRSRFLWRVRVLQGPAHHGQADVILP